jgi:DNA-binding NtrC family response regulator
VLDLAQQSALMPLVAAARACRIIATTSVPLFERVLQGSFDAGLFYALNTIHIKVGDRDTDDYD